MKKSESQKVEAYILQHFPMTNKEFSKALGVTVDVVKYHILKLGLRGQRKRGRLRLYDEYIKANYPTCSAGTIAEELGIIRNSVCRIARRIGVTHNPGFKKRPYPIKENLTGKKYGKLTVEKQLGTNKWGQMVYRCLCECGKIVTTTAGNLKNHMATSCGCNRKRNNL